MPPVLSPDSRKGRISNMTIERIGILGAGAVGASIAAMVMDATGGPEIAVVADGPREARIKREGITVNGREYRPPVTVSGPFDLIIVAVKSTDLEHSLPLLRLAAGANASVMSLMNGITSEGIITGALGNGRVIPAMIVGIDATRDGSGVRYLNRGTIHFGSDPASAPVPEEVLDSVERVLGICGIPCRRSADIVRTLWWKFMVNVGINQASAVLRGGYGLFQSSPEAVDLMRSAMEEVIALSRLEETGLDDGDMDDWIRTLMTLDPSGKTSMLQDMEAGRPTEVDLFAGTVLELARKHGIAVPVNATLYRIIRLTEERKTAGM